MKQGLFSRVSNGIVMAAAGLALLAGQALAKTELTVYTAVEAEDLKRYAEAFNEDYPDIEIKWVRDSTGIVTAKLLAEKDNPQADVIWGLAATSLLLMKGEGMLEPYAPAGLDKLDPKFRDKDDPPYWTGMDAWVASVCVNTVEAEKNNLPMPASWKDLTKPVYKGHVAMPNPNSSGTGRPARCRSAFPSHSAAPNPRLRARRSRSSCRRRASVGTWRRPRSSRAPKTSMPPRSSSTGRSPRKPTSFTTRAMRSLPFRALPSR
jgi:spermidine/putrescine-binding protein